MMRCGVECGANATLGPHALRNIARHLERRHAGYSGGEREDLQIEHELDVIFPGIRNSDRRVGQFTDVDARVVFFDLLNSTFDFANIVEVLSERSLVVRAEIFLQSGDFVGYPVQDALARSYAVRSAVARFRRHRTTARRPLRGSRVIGNGSVGDAQLIKSVYTQA